MLLYGRNQHDIVKQLSSNLKKFYKKKVNTVIMVLYFTLPRFLWANTWAKWVDNKILPRLQFCNESGVKREMGRGREGSREGRRAQKFWLEQHRARDPPTPQDGLVIPPRKPSAFSGCAGSTLDFCSTLTFTSCDSTHRSSCFHLVNQNHTLANSSPLQVEHRSSWLISQHLMTKYTYFPWDFVACQSHQALTRTINWTSGSDEWGLIN